jgi:hypothetical protein
MREWLVFNLSGHRYAFAADAFADAIEETAGDE